MIHGSEDRYVPVANARALAEEIAGARVRVIEGAGHLVFIERFGEVNREVITFLKPRMPRKDRRRRRTPAQRLVERAEAVGKGIFGGSRRHGKAQRKGGGKRGARGAGDSALRRFGRRLLGARVTRRWAAEAWARIS